MKFVVPACLFISIVIFNQSLFSQTHKPINVSLDRPRLFVRADASSIGSGLTVTQLRERMKDTSYAPWSSYNAEPSGWESLPAIAMQYLLSSDKKHAITVGQYLTTKSFPLHEHTSTAAAVYYSAIAFDWVRKALPQQMVDTITKHLSQGAEHLLEGVLQPAINHNYTFVSMHGVAMAALAIYGEGDENSRRAIEYIGMVDNLLTGEGLLLETFKQKKGIWGEGNHYTQFVVYYPLLMTLRALETASDAKYFDQVRNKYDNFLNPMAKFIVANFRPDFTMERTGDVTGRIVPVRSFMRPIIELLASEINVAELQGQLRSFSSALQEWYGPDLTSPVLGWMMMVTYSSQLPQTPSYKTLPLAMRLGENAYEHFMFRNNWHKNGTLITYVTGDHYTDHQHLDKGNFLIYKNGGLVIDGGVYSRMYGDHWSNYSSRTIAHNNVLIHDTSELTRTDPGNTIVYPDGGQVIKRGLQSHKNWNHYEQLKKDSGLDAGSVVAYATDNTNNIYHYVKSDLTTAYGNKSLWVDRQLLYLPGADYLIVRDRVITAKSNKKYWLLHFEGRPTVDAKTPAAGITNYKAANVVRVERVGDMNLGSNTIKYSGGLFVKTLLPLQRTTSVIGGSGFEYYNRFVNKNFPPDKPAPSTREAGNWRIEVSAATPTENTTFMHAIEITGATKHQMVPVTYIKSAEGKMDGAHFRSDSTNYLTMFSTNMDEKGHSHQNVKLPVSYSLTTKENTKHILAELQPGAKVKVMANRESIGVFQVNDAGVLMFTDKGKGTRKVQLTKVGEQ